MFRKCDHNTSKHRHNGLTLNGHENISNFWNSPASSCNFETMLNMTVAFITACRGSWRMTNVLSVTCDADAFAMEIQKSQTRKCGIVFTVYSAFI